MTRVNKVFNVIVTAICLIACFIAALYIYDTYIKGKSSNQRYENLSSESVSNDDNHETSANSEFVSEEQVNVENSQRQPKVPIIKKGEPAMLNPELSQARKVQRDEFLKELSISRFIRSDEKQRYIKKFEINRAVFNSDDMVVIEFFVPKPGKKTIVDNEGETYEVISKRYVYEIYIDEAKINSNAFTVSLKTEKSLQQASYEDDMQEIGYRGRITARNADEYDAIVYLVAKNRLPLFKNPNDTSSKNLSKETLLKTLEDNTSKILDAQVAQYQIYQEANPNTYDLDVCRGQIAKLVDDNPGVTSYSKVEMSYDTQMRFISTLTPLEFSIPGRRARQGFKAIFMVTDKQGVRLLNASQEEVNNLNGEYYFLKSESHVEGFAIIVNTEKPVLVDRSMGFEEMIQYLEKSKVKGYDLFPFKVTQ